MQITSKNHTSQEGVSLQDNDNMHQRILARFPWLQSPIFGYLFCVLLVGVLTLVEKVDQYFPHAPLFIGAPFALASMFVAMIWGIGPALFSIVLGVLVILTYLVPGTFTPNMSKDLFIIGPFVLLQLIAVVIVVRLQRSRQQIVAAKRVVEAYARELEQAQVLKDYVLVRAAHELRTPLTTIRGRTQLLSSRLEKTGKTPENWEAIRQYLPVIQARSLHLQGLIERLLDLSRAQSKAIPLKTHPCDLKKLCDEVIEDQRLLSGRVIEAELPDLTVVLNADSQMLAQVLINLLSNAIKYSPEQSPIYVRVWEEEKQGKIRIQNECVSLPSQEELLHLFEPFYRTPRIEYSAIPGWGLGLTISKEIIEQHGGQIWAEAPQEKNIAFVITLPLPVSAEGKGGRSKRGKPASSQMLEVND